MTKFQVHKLSANVSSPVVASGRYRFFNSRSSEIEGCISC